MDERLVLTIASYALMILLILSLSTAMSMHKAARIYSDRADPKCAVFEFRDALSLPFGSSSPDMAHMLSAHFASDSPVQLRYSELTAARKWFFLVRSVRAVHAYARDHLKAYRKLSDMPTCAERTIGLYWYYADIFANTDYFKIGDVLTEAEAYNGSVSDAADMHLTYLREELPLDRWAGVRRSYGINPWSGLISATVVFWLGQAVCWYFF
jgi:hypothetical protein